MEINPKHYNYQNAEELKQFIGQRVSMIERQDNHGGRRSGLVLRKDYICVDVKIMYSNGVHGEYAAATFYLKKDADSKRRNIITWFFNK